MTKSKMSEKIKQAIKESSLFFDVFYPDEYGLDTFDVREITLTFFLKPIFSSLNSLKFKK